MPCTGRLGAAAFALVLPLAACTHGEAPPSATSASPADSAAEHADRSDDLLADNLAADEPGCSAAVGIDGEVVWAGARGTADLATGRALDTDTTLDIGSVSKQFTAVAVLLLEQDGRLSLDDPLADWVPDLPRWSRDVTLTHLVHHTSGIPDYTHLLLNSGADLADPTTQLDAVDAIAGVETLDHPPGDRFAYSNSNYVLLAEVVQRAGGTSLPDFLRSRVFEPSGLAMVLDPFGASPDNSDEASARPYVRDPVTQEWQVAGSRWEQVGDGSIQTTPSELVRWADNYRTGEIGGERLLEAQLRDPADAGGADYGAGIVISRDGELRHTGGWAGFLSEFAVSADRRLAVAVSCNGDEGSSSPIGRIAPALMAEWQD
jgi:CubicO group peptidase (beta-lactamase class C family)